MDGQKLQEFVVSEMEKRGICKDKSNIWKYVLKLWGKWGRQGLLLSQPGAPLPCAQTVMCITSAAAADQHEKFVEWEEDNKHEWGPRV